MKKEEPILVAIHCLVYNHEPYLRDCFEGFVMQKTNFRFVAIVHEDASTDCSAAIIREYAEKYPDVIKPIYETENQWHKMDGTLTRIMTDAIVETGAKYVAMCEGDDYWTDENKLQKQVDFLENHPECSLCFHGVKILDENTHTYQHDFLENVPFSTSGIKLAQGNYIHSVSVMYRNADKIYKTMGTLGRLSMGDQIIYHLCAQNGTMVKLADIMAVYRVGKGSWSSSSATYRYIMSIISLSKTIPLITNNDVRMQLDETIYKYADCILKSSSKKEKELEVIQKSTAYRLCKLLLEPGKYITRLFQ